MSENENGITPNMLELMELVYRHMRQHGEYSCPICQSQSFFVGGVAMPSLAIMDLYPQWEHKPISDILDQGVYISLFCRVCGYKFELSAIAVEGAGELFDKMARGQDNER